MAPSRGDLKGATGVNLTLDIFEVRITLGFRAEFLGQVHLYGGNLGGTR